MSNKLKRAQNKGYTPKEILLMKELAKKEAQRAVEQIERESTEKALLFMLAIPLNVLVYEYWPKSDKKMAPKFIDDVLSLYEAVQQGVTTYEELTDLLKEYAGIDFTADWIKGRKEV